MKCEFCGRGITWRRIARDGAVLIARQPSPSTDRSYCGGCWIRGKVELQEGDVAYVVLMSAQLDYRLHPDQGHYRIRPLATFPAKC